MERRTRDLPFPGAALPLHRHASALHPEAGTVSAVRELGLEALTARIQRAALEGTVEERISLPSGDAAAMAVSAAS